MNRLRRFEDGLFEVVGFTLTCIVTLIMVGLWAGALFGAITLARWLLS